VATLGDSIGKLKDKLNSLYNFFGKLKEEVDHPTSLRIEVSVNHVIDAETLLKETVESVKAV
jgi:hypothetical protein